MTADEYDAFCRRAEAAGWHLDTSPQTELSALTYWRHGGTFELLDEDSLEHRLDYEQAMREAPEIRLTVQEVDDWAERLERQTEGHVREPRVNFHE